jgi:hypothetical protein
MKRATVFARMVMRAKPKDQQLRGAKHITRNLNVASHGVDRSLIVIRIKRRVMNRRKHRKTAQRRRPLRLFTEKLPHYAAAPGRGTHQADDSTRPT